MRKRVGLKDIAEALNVSITTVSRALNNKFDINTETRKAILEKAEELNYRRNPFAVSLRTNDNFTIGVILPFINHHFFSSVLKGIMNKAQMGGYLILIGESQQNVVKEKEIIDQFIAHCVTGVIIAPTVKSSANKNLSQFDQENIPSVMVDRLVDNYKGSYVKYNDVEGAFLATEHLIEQGFKRIGFIKGSDQCSISTNRLEGYLEALKKYNIPLDEKLIKKCALIDDEAEGYFMTKQLLSSRNRPDAIFAVTDHVAAGTYKAAKELGLKIPDDLGIVGYSNSNLASHLTPSLSTVEQSGIEMGELSFDFLQQSIIDSNKVLTKCYDANLIIRNSSIRNSVTHVVVPEFALTNK